MINQEELKRVLHYDPLTGIFTWKISKQGIKIGSIVGHNNGSGYLKFTLNRVKYYAHRLAFLYMKGYIPKYIDHKDRNRSNNIFTNLRPATSSQNNTNKTYYNTPSSGYIGVYFKKELISKPYQAKIMFNYKRIHLGYFSTAIEAAIIFDKASIKYHKEFAVTNFTRKNYA